MVEHRREKDRRTRIRSGAHQAPGRGEAAPPQTKEGGRWGGRADPPAANQHATRGDEQSLPPPTKQSSAATSLDSVAGLGPRCDASKDGTMIHDKTRELVTQTSEGDQKKIVLLVIDGMSGLPHPETGKTEMETARL